MLNNWNKNTLTYGGFWVRLAAYTIDSMIVFFALLLVRLLSSGLLSLADGTALGGNVLFSYTLKDIILYVFEALYFILFTYYTETTPGKRLLNLYVKAADGKKLTLTDVMYRETIGRFLCGATVLIGYIMAGVDKEKRGLHDMLCDTRVVYMKKIKVYPGFQMPQDINIPPVPRQVTQPPYMPYGQPPHMPGGCRQTCLLNIRRAGQRRICLHSICREHRGRQTWGAVTVWYVQRTRIRKGIHKNETTGFLL